MNPILLGSDYLALPREPETWLLKHLLPVGGAMILYGDPKIGKSYAALQLALALNGADTHWLGFPVLTPGRVVYVQLDTPHSLWADRLEQLHIAGLPIQHLHFSDRETLNCWPFDILHPPHFQLLQTSLLPFQPTAVFIDTLREAHSGDENDSTVMRNVVASLSAATQPAALVLVAHSRKPSDLPPDLMSDQRGSGYVVGRMDAIVRFTKKRAYYSGRAIEEGHIHITRLDTGLWEVDESEATIHLRTVLADPTLRSMRAQAKRLSELTGKGEEACRSFIRRVA